MTPSEALKTAPKWAYGLFALIGIGLLIATAQVLPAGIDWENSFTPAAEALLAGENPYKADFGEIGGTTLRVYNPPWAFAIVAPLTLLPFSLSNAVMFWGAFITYTYVTYRLSGGDKWVTGFFLTTPMILIALGSGNVEWLVYLSLILPPPIAMLFLSIKPQVGIVMMVVLSLQAYRGGGWRGLIPLWLPLLLATLLSIAAYGAWWEWALKSPDLDWNASLFPLLVPVGIYWIWLACLPEQDSHTRWRFGLAASPLFSPYLTFHTWSIVSVSALRRRWVYVGIWVILWGYTIVRLVG